MHFILVKISYNRALSAQKREYLNILGGYYVIGGSWGFRMRNILKKRNLAKISDFENVLYFS